jgi:hypothetical protein
VDDDDLWAPDKLIRQIEHADANGRAWAYAGAVNIGDSLRVVSGVPPPSPTQIVRLITRYNAIPGGGSNVIVRREVFERVGPFDLGLKNTEDWEMWIRLTELGPPACAQYPLLAYRVHASNASLDLAAILEGVSRIERRHGIRADRGVMHRWIGESCLRTGQRAEALKHLAVAAVGGQAVGVARDVLAIVRRRLEPMVGPAIGTPRGPSEWMSQAQAWLDVLAID